MIGAEGTSTWV